VESRLDRLRRGLRGRAEVRSTSAKWAWVEAVLATGGEAEGLALLDAVRKGGGFAAYKAAFAAAGAGAKGKAFARDVPGSRPHEPPSSPPHEPSSSPPHESSSPHEPSSSPPHESSSPPHEPSSSPLAAPEPLPSVAKEGRRALPIVAAGAPRTP
jgi:hypothetical protein